MNVSSLKASPLASAERPVQRPQSAPASSAQTPPPQASAASASRPTVNPQGHTTGRVLNATA